MKSIPSVWKLLLFSSLSWLSGNSYGRYCEPVVGVFSAAHAQQLSTFNNINAFGSIVQQSVQASVLGAAVTVAKVAWAGGFNAASTINFLKSNYQKNYLATADFSHQEYAKLFKLKCIDWSHYIAKAGIGNSAAFRQWSLYQFPEFCAYLKKQPDYEERILAIGIGEDGAVFSVETDDWYYYLSPHDTWCNEIAHAGRETAQKIYQAVRTLQHQIYKNYAQQARVERAKTERDRQQQEQKERQRIEQEQKRAEHEQQEEMRKIQLREQELYVEELHVIEMHISDNGTVNYKEERLGAIAQTRVDFKRIERHFDVSQAIRTFAARYEISEAALASAIMNSYESQLHTEFIEHLESAESLSGFYKNSSDYSIFLDVIGHGVACGIEANHQHQPMMATYWADAGKELIKIARAIGEGVACGVYNTVSFNAHLIQGAASAVCHPVDSFCTLGRGIVKVCSLISAGVVEVAGHIHFDAENETFTTDISWEQLKNQVSALGDLCLQKINEMPREDKIKHTVTFATEVVAPAKIFQLIHYICRSMRPLIIAALHAIRDEKVIARIAGTGETLLMCASEKAEKIGGAVNKALQASYRAFECFHIEFMKRIRKEIEVLRPLFDNTRKGFAEFANKYIKLDYEHLMGMHLKWARDGAPKISGFHHDLAHAVEKSGFVKFTNKIVNKFGVYSADLIICGKKFPHKTFFPAEWSREQVVGAIYEAYDNFIKSGGVATLESDGKYLVEGFTKEGIKIIMHITKKGMIKTAYPKL